MCKNNTKNGLESMLFKKKNKKIKSAKNMQLYFILKLHIKALFNTLNKILQERQKREGKR